MIIDKIRNYRKPLEEQSHLKNRLYDQRLGNGVDE